MRRLGLQGGPQVGLQGGYEEVLLGENSGERNISRERELKGENSREGPQEREIKRESSRETYQAREDASFQGREEGRRFKGRCHAL